MSSSGESGANSSTEDDRARARAIAYGCISLNSAFVVRYSPIRLFKKKSLRLSLPEMIWIVLATLFYAAVLALLVLLFSVIPVIRDMSSWLLVALAPFGGWITGRRIARASPYRQHSGEGLSEFLWVQSDKVGPVLGKLFGRKIIMSDVTTRASGKLVTTEAIEWIGTGRAQLMPIYRADSNNTSMDVILVPSTVPTNWARRVQLDKVRPGRKSF